MTASDDPSPLPAFAKAIAAQQRLERALRAAGLDPAVDFPRMVADVDTLGEPRIVLGPITTATAERLADVIGSADTNQRQ